MNHTEALKYARRFMQSSGVLAAALLSANLINLVARSFQ